MLALRCCFGHIWFKNNSTLTIVKILTLSFDSRTLQYFGTTCLPVARETTARDMQLVQCWWATSGVSSASSVKSIKTTETVFSSHFFISVSNKWIHERGQEWRRPCGLSESEWLKWRPHSPLHPHSSVTSGWNHPGPNQDGCRLPMTYWQMEFSFAKHSTRLQSGSKHGDCLG